MRADRQTIRLGRRAGQQAVKQEGQQAVKQKGRHANNQVWQVNNLA
jgi:hypothetical protein